MEINDHSRISNRRNSSASSSRPEQRLQNAREEKINIGAVMELGCTRVRGTDERIETASSLAPAGRVTTASRQHCFHDVSIRSSTRWRSTRRQLKTFITTATALTMLSLRLHYKPHCITTLCTLPTAAKGESATTYYYYYYYYCHY